MHRIGKSFGFEAAHRLSGLPEGHKCGRSHGHSYSVEVRLAARRLSGPGFVADFAVLDEFRAYLQRTFDHRDLNDVMDAEPTSENLARHFFRWCATGLALPDGVRVESVRVSETASTWAEYAPEEA
ncbi:6-pyruvoyl trahydropterin synthase family protein [Actinomadura rayongensis]|uniref:6-carboxy-5,6,7,8-tetrahydropterin synthase n=1 Tax=Actinomadura rayongensis TaxID=1429076 RepID=A0A6I4WCX5_9ACTN|nr:6-carboxytetrahydropterin synthase [Actinomadura rayongensis]MXQ64914.1 6-carboxytetrahydropterin synthase QueD [Actinomadura rayongensis]